MLLLLALVFVVIPIVEILVIIRVGEMIGAGWTVVLLVADSLLGAFLLRREGARSWRQLRDALAEGRWPGDAVAHGAMVIVGGTLLVTPGFVTDVVGLLLLFRPMRTAVLAGARGRVGSAGARPRFGPRTARHSGPRTARRSGPRTARHSGPRRSGESRQRTAGGQVLDVEVIDVRRGSGPTTSTDRPPLADPSDDPDTPTGVDGADADDADSGPRGPDAPDRPDQ